MAAQGLKAEGNAFFKAGKLAEASGCYTRALDILAGAGAGVGAGAGPGAGAAGGGAEELKLKIACYVNRAACSLGKGPAEDVSSLDSVVEDCTAVLALDGGHVKALYRRALALERKGDEAGAFRDAAALVSIDPKNRPGLELARRLKESVSRKAEDSGVNKAMRLLRDPGSGAEVMMSCAGLAARSSSDAKGLVMKGAVPLLWARLRGCASAIHALCSLSQHAALVPAVVGAGAGANLEAAADLATSADAVTRDAVAALSLLRHAAAGALLRRGLYP